VNNTEITNRLKDLQTLLLDFLEIDRKVYLPVGNMKERLENDTEHTYHLAMLGWFMCGALPHLNKDLVIKYALTHDLVEIYAGDVMAVGRTEDEHEQKEKDEAQALNRLKSEWPDFQDMTHAIDSYEKQQDPEAVFVKALDKILPVLLGIIGRGSTWRAHNLARTDVIKIKDKKTKDSKEINEIWKILKKELLENDSYFNPDKR
jgi:putative hydrolase of HD superfamily